MKIQYESVEVLASYAQHLKNLTPQDRYTRFCYHVQDDSIDRLILQVLYYPTDHHLFSASVDNHAVGFVHLAREGTGWELAVSVAQEYQAQGIADQLMEYALTWGKTHGIHSVFMHCITQNTKIQHLARKHGLRMVERDGAEVTSRVELPPATTLDYTTEFVREQQTIFEQIVDLQRRMIRNFNPVTYINKHTLN